MEPIYQIPSKRLSTKTERAKVWQQIISDQKQSGMKMTRFCQKHQLILSTFKQWKYQLQKEREQHDNRVSEGANKEHNKPLNRATKFIPLQIVADDSLMAADNGNTQRNTSLRTEIKIVFRNGHAILMPLATCEKLALSLIHQIANLPC